MVVVAGEKDKACATALDFGNEDDEDNEDKMLCRVPLSQCLLGREGHFGVTFMAHQVLNNGHRLLVWSSASSYRLLNTFSMSICLT